MKLLNVFLLVFILVSLSACQMDTGEGGPLPKREPVHDRAVSNELPISFELSASTNCAEPGESITYTIRLKNNLTTPLTITNDIDINILPSPLADQTLPIIKWSNTNQYPEINPVLDADKERIYQWIWPADPRYKSENLAANTIRVTSKIQFRLPSSNVVRANGGTITIGIGSVNYGLGGLPCSQMQQ